MIAALSPASSASESSVRNRERSLLAARNELVAHKTRKLNMSIRAGMRAILINFLALSINFRLNSARAPVSICKMGSNLKAIRLAFFLVFFSSLNVFGQ
jgi:hypothetical protein